MSDAMLTSLPCEVCGTAVFQRTARRKRFCSKTCARRYWHTTLKGRSRRREQSWQSATITVLYADNGLRSFVGHGHSQGEAHRHARAQAQRFGPFTEVGYVTIPKLRADLARHRG